MNLDLFYHIVDTAFLESDTGRVMFMEEAEDADQIVLTKEEWIKWDVNDILGFSFNLPLWTEKIDENGEPQWVVSYR